MPPPPLELARLCFCDFLWPCFFFAGFLTTHMPFFRTFPFEQVFGVGGLPGPGCVELGAFSAAGTGVGEGRQASPEQLDWAKLKPPSMRAS